MTYPTRPWQRRPLSLPGVTVTRSLGSQRQHLTIWPISNGSLALLERAVEFGSTSCLPAAVNLAHILKLAPYQPFASYSRTVIG